MLLRARIIFTLLFTPAAIFAQLNVDSLKESMAKLAADTTTINHLIELSEKYAVNDGEASMAYAEKAFQLANTLGYAASKAVANLNIGTRYYNRSNYIKAASHYLTALKLSEDNALPQSQARALNGLGTVYAMQHQYDIALAYFQKALDAQRKLGNRKRQAIVLGNIANIYYSLQLKDKSNLRRSLDAHEKILEIYRQDHDTLQMIGTLDNIGLVSADMKDFDKSLTALNEARQLIELSRNEANQPYNYSFFGRAYGQMENYPLANKYFEKTIETSIKQHNLDMIMDSYVSLSENYYEMKDYKKAHDYHIKYTQLKDSLLSAENLKEISEMTNLLENTKRQKEMDRLKMDAKKQKIVNYSLGAGSLLLGLLALMIFSRYKLKNKSNQILQSQNLIIAQKNKDITDSINYAKKIQEALMPSPETLKNFFNRSFLFYLPKDIVSGDFYWFAEKNNFRYFAAADCTGHGVPGALMSMIGIEKLNESLNHYTSPNEMLGFLNAALKKALQQTGDHISRDGMDIALCCYNSATGTLHYAGANRPLLLCSKNGTEPLEIKATKTAIGGFTKEDQLFELHEINVNKGDTAYLYTDGYADQFGGKDGKKLMSRKLKELLFSLKGLPLEEQQHQIASQYLSWKNNFEQVDDVLVMGIEF